MPKFFVTVTRDTTESTIVDVEAPTKHEAIAKALAEARDNPGAFDWEADECVAGEPYIGDEDQDCAA